MRVIIFDVMEIKRHNDTVWNSYCDGSCRLSRNYCWDRAEVVVDSWVEVAADADQWKLLSFQILN